MEGPTSCPMENWQLASLRLSMRAKIAKVCLRRRGNRRTQMRKLVSVPEPNKTEHSADTVNLSYNEFQIPREGFVTQRLAQISI